MGSCYRIILPPDREIVIEGGDEKLQRATMACALVVLGCLGKRGNSKEKPLGPVLMSIRRHADDIGYEVEASITDNGTPQSSTVISPTIHGAAQHAITSLYPRTI